VTNVPFRSVPGEHCGSTAMRNLLAHYVGLELSEAMVFGIGSGIDFLYLESKELTPSVFCSGRSVTLEQDVASALGVDYREQIEPDDARAFALVRDEVLAGRPTMLSGDAFYLDYRDFKVHFPAHRFVLVGLDDAEEVAWVVDRLVPEPQRCSYAALRLSRNPPDFISTYNLWGKFHGTTQGRSLEQACVLALARSAQRMLGNDRSQMEMIAALGGGRKFHVETGIAGLKRFAAELPGWSDRPDSRALARYTSACIEKYGTGGGMFRTLFAEFLREVRQIVPESVPADIPERAAASAKRWTELAGELDGFAADGTDRAARAASEIVSAIIEIERGMFDRLARTPAPRAST